MRAEVGQLTDGQGHPAALHEGLGNDTMSHSKHADTLKDSKGQIVGKHWPFTSSKLLHCYKLLATQSIALTKNESLCDPGCEGLPSLMGTKPEFVIQCTFATDVWTSHLDQHIHRHWCKSCAVQSIRHLTASMHPL